jgi:hypothetical protein
MSSQLGSFMTGFEGYWRRNRAAVEEIIRSHVIVLDTNVLLEMYRMDHVAREEFFNVLDAAQQRIWIPRQVALEFHRNRVSALSTYLNTTKSVANEVWEAAESLKAALRKFAKNRSLTGSRKDEFLTPLQENIDKVTTGIKHNVSSFDLTLEMIVSDDPVLQRLAKLLDGRIGAETSATEMGNIIKEAERRAGEQIPPGYKDSKKKRRRGWGLHHLARDARTCQNK